MKKLILTVAMLGACTAAFAQGKITIQNDDLSALMFPTAATSMLVADVALAGQAIPTGPLPSGVFLMFGLYGAQGAGIPAGSLNFLGSVAFNTAAGTGNQAGLVTPTHLILPFEGGTVDTFQVRIWDARYSNYGNALTANDSYLGEGALFQMTPGLSSKLPYPGINNGGGSTWSAAPIGVSAVTIPEPATFALAGLGAAALLIFRRRK